MVTTSDTAHSPTAVRAQMARVLASEGFARSPRLSEFLRFIVAETLAGKGDRLKEYVIAVEVFERDASFDPKTNAVVRVEANRLRHRLQEYFLGAGRDDPLRIALPPGGYMPEFSVPVAYGKTPPALPGKPSSAVLPLAVIGGEREQEYFADGMAEDLITALSRIRWLFVIARNSSFAYRGTSPDIRQVGIDLGVRYVVEGSVRKEGKRVRISAQLINAQNSSHVWAERYDRELEDIFAVQDEITERIVAAIELEVSEAERERARRKATENLDAWAGLNEAPTIQSWV